MEPRAQRHQGDFFRSRSAPARSLIAEQGGVVGEDPAIHQQPFLAGGVGVDHWWEERRGGRRGAGCGDHGDILLAPLAHLVGVKQHRLLGADVVGGDDRVAQRVAEHGAAELAGEDFDEPRRVVTGIAEARIGAEQCRRR